MKLSCISFLTVIILMSSCRHSKQQKDNLRKRSNELAAKEQQLQRWEDSLKLKEQELIKREQAIDSLSKQIDSAGIYNPALVGNWHVMMHCTETSCEGSAIGDTKTEKWNISYQNNQVIARVTSNNKFSRVYQGLYKGNRLQLINRQQQQNTETIITINLHPTSENKMEGEREINQVGNCKIIYDIEIEKL